MFSVSKPRRVLAIASACLLSTVTGACGGGAESTPGEVTVGVYPGLLTSYLTVTAAEQGIFKKNGLTVKTVPINVGAQQTSALLGGSLDIADLPAPTVVPLMEKGQGDLKVLTGGTEFNYDLIIQPGEAGEEAAEGFPTAAAALKGRTVAVNQSGGTLDYFVRLLAQEAGLDPADDYTTVGSGSVAAGLSGFSEGKFDATVLFPELSHIVGTPGKDYTVLASTTDGSTGDLFTDRVQTFLGTTGKWASENKDDLKSFCKSIGEAAAWLEDPANAASVKKSLAAMTKQPADSIYPVFKKTAFQPVMTEEIWQKQAVIVGRDSMPDFDKFVSAECQSQLGS